MDFTLVDIPFVLDLIRPGSGYVWLADSYKGASYEAIGEWLDTSTRKPSKTELWQAWLDNRHLLDEKITRQAHSDELSRLEADGNQAIRLNALRLQTLEKRVIFQRLKRLEDLAGGS